MAAGREQGWQEAGQKGNVQPIQLHAVETTGWGETSRRSQARQCSAVATLPLDRVWQVPSL